MDAKEAEFLKRIMATFRVEALEHIQNISAGLLELEKSPEQARHDELIEMVFRETHSLKGAARSVDQRDIEYLCQPLESTFSALKRGQISLTPEICDILHQGVDFISLLMSSTESGAAPAPRARLRELALLLGRISQPSGDDSAASATPPPAEPRESPRPAAPTPPTPAPTESRRGLGESVRIPTSKLDPLLLQAEELLSAKLAAEQRVADLLALGREMAAWKIEIRPDAERHSLLERQAADAARLNALRHRMEALASAMAEDHRALKRMVDEHLEEMKKILMLPAAVIVDVLPRLVRDLSRQQGKEVTLSIAGAEIEMDKRILEELKTPLIHLIRNCIDHGLQRPHERAKQGKPSQGLISLTIAAQDSRHVEITLSDDGVGIDLEKVRAAAVGKGVVQAEEAATSAPSQGLELIFQSGVSTSPIITDISGRGLGLAIVRERVEKLGGQVSVESRRREGATFRMVLPMTLATFRGVLTRAGEHFFLVPTSNVERVLRVGRSEIKTVESQRTIALEGEVLPLVDLARCLGLAQPPGPPPRRADAQGGEAAVHLPALVLASSGRRMAFQVDEILHEQQVLLKSLGPQLGRLRNIAGATVLGNGLVVPVINVPDLMISALRPAAGAPEPAREVEPSRRGRVLVAEDSITSRTLIKNILETAGYQVNTAVDGMDAFTQLRGGDFQLVVSDVEMPRLNGFELTAKIRGDRKLEALPVVLVTALESREDRERGIEVGADAYIIKSSFDQSNLLGVVGKLL